MNQKNSFIFTILNPPSDRRLDKFLVSADFIIEDPDFLFLKNFNRSQWQDLIEKGQIEVNGAPAKSSLKLKVNDILSITAVEKINVGIVPTYIPLDIVFEDKDVIVINKQSGLVIHPGAGHESDTLVNALLFHTKDLSMKNEERPGIVHRIDKETSGLLVVAKNDRAHELLSEQFKLKTTHRIYYAVAQAPKNPIAKSGRIETVLARHPTDRKRYASLKGTSSNIGKNAITHYQVVESVNDKFLFKLKLETGRTHQIRIHLKELGCILIGDLLYGYSQKKFEDEGLNRFYLHAAELGFQHPTTLGELKFSTSWPKADLQKIRDWGFTFEF